MLNGAQQRAIEIGYALDTFEVKPLLEARMSSNG